MNILQTLDADLHKILAWLPFFAAVDPNAANGITKAQATVAALQPGIAAIQAAANGALTHDELVTKVSAVAAQASSALASVGEVSAEADAKVQSLAALIPIAVAASGIAAQPAAPAGQ